MNRHARNTLAWITAIVLGAGACGKNADPSKAAARAKDRDAIAAPHIDETKKIAEPLAPPPATEKDAIDGTKAHQQAAVSRGQMGVMAAPMKRPPGHTGAGYLDEGEAPPPRQPNTEQYQHHDANKLTLTEKDHLSTFSIDVDTASYAIVRKKIQSGEQVPADAVRVEEFLNYFRYHYAAPQGGKPFAVDMEAAPSPFTKGRHILRVGVQGKQIAKSDRKKAHLVFLVDVSGSMDDPAKLPLVKQALRILVQNLNDGDTVSLVTYAGNTRVVLGPTEMNEKAKIYEAIEDLNAGGSTAMASGIELAYQLAAKQITKDSISRVLVLTDGDANVGSTTHEEILKSIAGYVAKGVTLSTVGFGMGNYKDTMMEQLADKGNGASYYIDSLSEAKKVFQEQLGATLEVIAKDVKIQVDFNPAAVGAYRLIGYENRDIADNDFRNDKVDAGEIGAGASVTALYEVELTDKARAGKETTLATVRIRAKTPRGIEAAEDVYPFAAESLHGEFGEASQDLRFATAVMGFAEILRKSPYADGWKIDDVLAIAKAASGGDDTDRQEFLSLVASFSKRS